MPSVLLHTSSSTPSPVPPTQNPLPSLLRTPLGLAILEIQGTLHVPALDTDSVQASSKDDCSETLVGQLEFPYYDATDPENTAWMKRVYFYVGKHQRLTGEVKKLARPIAIIRRRAPTTQAVSSDQAMDVSINVDEGQEELEIADIVSFKILFASRPEPMGS